MDPELGVRLRPLEGRQGTAVVVEGVERRQHASLAKLEGKVSLVANRPRVAGQGRQAQGRRTLGVELDLSGRRGEAAFAIGHVIEAAPLRDATELPQRAEGQPPAALWLEERIHVRLDRRPREEVLD